MRPPKPRYFQNRRDLAASVQVRVLRKRGRNSDVELTPTASKRGNSFSATFKEVNVHRVEKLLLERCCCKVSETTDVFLVVRAALT